MWGHHYLRRLVSEVTFIWSSWWGVRSPLSEAAGESSHLYLKRLVSEVTFIWDGWWGRAPLSEAAGEWGHLYLKRLVSEVTFIWGGWWVRSPLSEAAFEWGHLYLRRLVSEVTFIWGGWWVRSPLSQAAVEWCHLYLRWLVGEVSQHEVLHASNGPQASFDVTIFRILHQSQSVLPWHAAVEQHYNHLRINQWLVNKLIIIYDYFLPPWRRGSHVKSDYANTITQHTPLSPHTMHLRRDFQ